MRILIDGRMILPEMTGVGRYLLGLCRALADLDSDLVYELWVQETTPADHPIFQLSGKSISIPPGAAAPNQPLGTAALPHLSARSQTRSAALPALRPAVSYPRQGCGDHPRLKISGPPGVLPTPVRLEKISYAQN